MLKFLVIDPSLYIFMGMRQLSAAENSSGNLYAPIPIYARRSNYIITDSGEVASIQVKVQAHGYYCSSRWLSQKRYPKLERRNPGQVLDKPKKKRKKKKKKKKRNPKLELSILRPFQTSSNPTVERAH